MGPIESRLLVVFILFGGLVNVQVDHAIIMAGLSTAFSVFLLLFLQCLSYNGALAQYLVEILEPASFGNHRPIFRCDATGADFGEDVLTFSFRVNYGCALPTLPSNACGDVQMPPTNDTACANYFAVVPRSNCSFSEKAYHVQTSTPTGFGALIVYGEPGTVPETMSGARYSDRINIPVVMVDYECMQGLQYRYSYRDGYIVSIKVNPEERYYRPLTYVALLAAVILFGLALLSLSKIILLCRERPSTTQLPKSSFKKVSILNSDEIDCN
uniref:PA domain-containing protein n=1 Tax=Panagrellus redivivus TaxID=6233 RepID=A0A7E4URB3_PANRE